MLSILPTSPRAHSGELAHRMCQTPSPEQLCRCSLGSVPAAPPGRCQPRGNTPRPHPPPVPWLGFSGVLPPGKVEVGAARVQCCWGWGSGGALPCPRHPMGGIAMGGITAAACPGSGRGAGAVEWGSRILWCPEGAGKVLVLLPACWIPHRTATTALCFPAPSPPSRSQGRGVSWVPPQVFIPVTVTGAEGMCPWQGGTDSGTLLPALAAIVSPGCKAACPGHRAEGR